MSSHSDAPLNLERRQCEEGIIDSGTSATTHAVYVERESSGLKHLNVSTSPSDCTVSSKGGDCQISGADKHDIPSNKVRYARNLKKFKALTILEAEARTFKQFHFLWALRDGKASSKALAQAAVDNPEVSCRSRFHCGFARQAGFA
ncbi:pumilio-family RNA binding repeat protein [Aspergillus luchuensis]|uniref:Pumilio-family RNA binding repeat protein n=1 Tax=Aspergillus kawachii TaxID=1069201 RepID=A0A146FPJ8_ASPKA|nr:pumilio-family RNA binding repeat protein [Aspergillus luchuensis]